MGFRRARRLGARGVEEMWRDPALVKAVGPVHGMLFLLFVLGTLRVGVEQSWRFRETTWKVLVACVVPFGTFYIDRRVLSRIL
jgi:integral membrane protein